jgi:hypothetical protein
MFCLSALWLGKDFHNKALRLDRWHSTPVTRIAHHHYIRVKVTCFTNVHLYISSGTRSRLGLSLTVL